MKKNPLQNLIFLCKIKKAKSILELAFLPSNFWKTDISQEAFVKFFDGARAFFSKACQYYVKWLPLEDSLFQNCKLV